MRNYTVTLWLDIDATGDVEARRIAQDLLDAADQRQARCCDKPSDGTWDLEETEE